MGVLESSEVVANVVAPWICPIPSRRCNTTLAHVRVRSGWSWVSPRPDRMSLRLVGHFPYGGCHMLWVRCFRKFISSSRCCSTLDLAHSIKKVQHYASLWHNNVDAAVRLGGSVWLRSCQLASIQCCYQEVSRTVLCSHHPVIIPSSARHPVHPGHPGSSRASCIIPVIPAIPVIPVTVHQHM